MISRRGFFGAAALPLAAKVTRPAPTRRVWGMVPGWVLTGPPTGWPQWHNGNLVLPRGWKAQMLRLVAHG